MKKHLLFIGLLTCILVAFSGCSQPVDKAATPSENAQVTTAETPVMTTKDPEMVEMTLEDLSTFDGKNGNPAYVAVDGIVYDVSQLEKWKNGDHQGQVTAGKDLSKEIEASPHGKSMLEKAIKIGTLKQ